MAEFITKKENTRRLAIIIVCVIADALCLAVLIYAYNKYSFYETSQKNANINPKLSQRLREGRDENKRLERILLSFGGKVGWKVSGGGTTDRFGAGPVQNDVLKSFLSAAARPTKEEESRGIKSMLQYLGINTYKRWDDLGSGGNDTLLLTKLFDELLNKEGQYITKIKDLEGQIKTENDNQKRLMDDLEKAMVDAKKGLDGGATAAAPAGGAIGDLIRLLKELNQLQKSHSEELVQTEKDTNDALTKSTETKNENIRKRAAAESVKADLKRRIYAIQHHREDLISRREPNGEILGIDEYRQIVYIDLLRKNRLWKGTRFTCYSLEKGGQKLDKGTIEVVEVREEVSSICSILKVADPSFPLKVGDKIYNELYEGGRTRNIAFAGRFTGRISNEEAAALIRKFGDNYQEKADENTNYVVVADGYEEHPNYKAAQEYGIKVLREKILYDYLGVRRD